MKYFVYMIKYDKCTINTRYIMSNIWTMQNLLWNCLNKWYDFINIWYYGLNM